MVYDYGVASTPRPPPAGASVHFSPASGGICGNHKKKSQLCSPPTKLAKMKSTQIKEKLQTYAIEELANRTRFNLRRDAKVKALIFVLGFFEVITQGYSLRKWAQRISTYLLGDCLSKAGLQKRFSSRTVKFCLDLLGRILRGHFFDPLSRFKLSSPLLSSFAHVYVVDSSCLSLNSSLAWLFPGSHSSTGQAATARIQVCLELKQHLFRYFSLASFRNNDQSHSPAILSFLQAGDLVLRDMGYWSLKVFRAIMAHQASFLSRFRYGAYLYHPHSGAQIPLGKLLKSATQKGLAYIDRPILVGKKAQLPVRFVAIRLPEQIANERIRKAKQQRNQDTNHSKEYYEHLKWNIFLTNVPTQTWTAQQILQVYGLRWRIEILFKVWKSNFGLRTILERSKIQSPNHLYIFLYLFLAYVTLVHLGFYHYFLFMIYQQYRKYLSWQLFAQFVQEQAQELFKAQKEQRLDQFLELLATFYCHEKRKNRLPQLYYFFH